MSSQRKRVANPRRSRGGRPDLGPRAMRTNLEFRHQFRFTSSSATATSITDITLLAAAGVLATSTTVGHTLWQGVRVNQIEIWTPPASQGAAATCSVAFPPASGIGSFAMPREITDTTVSVSQPAHVITSPPPGSLCGFWQNGSASGALMTLTAPVGSIIDIWVSLVAKDGDTGYTANTATLVGATVGAVYYTSLDSKTSAGSVYHPVGLTTA